ncbi:hypothetical protein FRC12_005505 [Ceratobasidium sp. 428]|nr:hypothetical protein FRC12_005505 [Ceratobasidium sp. 428]
MHYKNLAIHAYNLQREVTLLLVFQPPDSSTLYCDLFPVVWKQLNFPAEDRIIKHRVSYIQRLAFGYEQTVSDSSSAVHHSVHRTFQEDDNRVASSEWIDIKRGDATSITGTEDEKKFGPVTHNPDTNAVACENKSNTPMDLNLGLVRGKGVDERFEPTLLWKDLQRGTSAITEFKPILQVYVDKGNKGSSVLLLVVDPCAHRQHHKDYQVLREKLELDPILTQDLNELDDVTSWTLIEHSETGGYRLEPDTVVG